MAAQANKPIKEPGGVEHTPPFQNMKIWRTISIILLMIMVTRSSITRDSPNNQNQLMEFTPSPNIIINSKSDQQNNYRIKKKLSNPTGIVPARIYIPVIDLHANIDAVTVLDNGQMGVPKSSGKVGYLLNGILPGAIGNAVMDGHYDSSKGPAVFYHLKRLKQGDVVIVKNERGNTMEFVVQAVKAYKTSEAPINEIFGSSIEPRLNLITCAGKYSRSKKEHLERLVVYTKRLSEGGENNP